MDEDQRYIKALRRDLKASQAAHETCEEEFGDLLNRYSNLRKEMQHLKEENVLLMNTIAATSTRNVVLSEELRKVREPD